MNKVTAKVLHRLRRIHARFIDPKAHEPKPRRIDVRGQEVSDRIRALLEGDRPCMVGRLGGSEMDVIVRYLHEEDPKPFLAKAGEYIRGRRPAFWLDERVVSNLCSFSGFFPDSRELAIKFSQDMLRDMQQLDILGSWQEQESEVDAYLTNAVRVPHGELQPYRHANPWSEALAGRKVLVIHPFDQSILSQWQKRELLFKDPRVLPKFDLIMMKSVQSLLLTKVPFRDWFEALDSMIVKIDQTDFDIAILGAGAYGLPLAAHVKRIGKKAVHLGGVTQMLFGIRGKRWDDRPEYQQFFNEHWVRPLPEEAPSNFKTMEKGCYW